MRYLYVHTNSFGTNLWSREYSSVTKVASVVMVNNGHGDMIAIRNTDGQFESLSSEEL